MCNILSLNNAQKYILYSRVAVQRNCRQYICYLWERRVFDCMGCDGGGHRGSAPFTVGAVDDYTCMHGSTDQYFEVWMDMVSLTERNKYSLIPNKLII